MVTKISGSTGVDKVQDGSITQADLAPNVAGNGPCFSVTLAASQGVVGGSVMNTVAFDSEEFDTGSCFASNRFTAPVAGFYSIVAALVVSAPMTNGQIYILKNGVVYKSCGPSSDDWLYISCIVQLNVGDSVMCGLTRAEGTAASINQFPSQTYFQGFLARAA